MKTKAQEIQAQLDRGEISPLEAAVLQASARQDSAREALQVAYRGGDLRTIEAAQKRLRDATAALPPIMRS